MLTWFKDAALTLPITAITPKWASIPLKGGVKQTSVWLGDAYTSLVAQPVGIGDTTIFLTQTDEFAQTGTIVIGSEQITYTGVTSAPGASLTGCTRGANGTTAAAYTVGTTVFPITTYTGGSNIIIGVGGMLAGPVGLGLGLPNQNFGPPGVPLLLPTDSVISGIANAIQINLQFTTGIGVEMEYTNLSVTTISLTRPGDTTSGFASIVVQPAAVLYVEQRDQGLVQHMRLLPLNRQVNANLPGFEWGEYRWRDNTTENAQTVVPTKWDIDTSLIAQDFIGGVGSIGETNDLQPIDLEEVESSIFLRAQRGQYFTGVKRYYLPSDNFNLEFLPCYPGLPNTYQLLAPPKSQTPVFVGNWRVDSQGFYEYSLNARYTFGPNFDMGGPNPQFTVDRVTGILTVSNSVQIPQATILMGVLSGALTEVFDMPIYPVDKIVHLYVGNPIIAIPTYTFDRENGTLQFPKTPGTSGGQPLFAVVDAAIAVLYEIDTGSTVEIQNTNVPDEEVLLQNTRLLTPDLNPAFSGLSNGYVYLQHRVLKPVGVILSADKPQIAIPPTLSTIIGLIAYGPVFYNGDHSLLTAKAVGSLPNEAIPGARLEVIPGGLNEITGQPLQNYPFRGLINGLDPNTNDIVVTTGGDGIANLVFQPEPNFGFYIPTTAPWITESTTQTPSAATWTLGLATLTLASPLKHTMTVGSGIRLAGFTPSDWDGDYPIVAVDATAHTVKIAIVSDPGTATSIGTVGSLDTLLLPLPIAISQLWAGPPDNEGWLEFIYGVLSNDPLFGESPLPLTGNASITSGVATIHASNTPPKTVSISDSITIVGATSPTLDGSYRVASATLTASVWAITYLTTAGNLTSTAQTAGTVNSTGALPFTMDGTVNGDVTILNAAWSGSVATFTLASQPTNLEVGQNVDIIGCTTGTLNGIQNVLSIFEVTGTWFITTPTTTAGSGSESESGASFNYSNFRTNGVLSVWQKILPFWQASFNYQVGDQIIDTNQNIETVTAISGSGTSGSSIPTFNPNFGVTTVDNQVTWTNFGVQGSSTSIPIHAFDKNGNDYSSGIYVVTGNAQIASGMSFNTATVQVLDNGGTISPGDQVEIRNATSSSLNGTWVVVTAALSTGVWTITFHTAAVPFGSTPQINGVLIDTLFDGNVVSLQFNQGLPIASQGFVQAYLFQFLEREIIQLRVVGTNILSNSIMLQMQTPEQILNNPYLVLSTDATTTPPFYAGADANSRFNINRLGIVPSVVTVPSP